ncbi:MAG: hypothetical protein BGP06_12495 [Rhizobiales bacterium 65-9]|nr:MAG: hypothetical protein BGP06_12495 [Rhizobiales bacterium 65-9]
MIRALVGLLALALSAMANPAFSQEKVTVRAVMESDIKILDPIFTGTYVTRNYGYMIYDTLFSQDADGKPQLQMLQSYTVSDDQLLYTFVLREGLKWHDGANVTSTDCVTSLGRWMNRDGNGRALKPMIQAMEAVDSRTFTIKLLKPTALLIRGLSKPSSIVPFMMPERVAKTPATAQLSEYIGSGPFRMVVKEWQPGAKIVFEKFKDYIPRNEPASGLAGGKRVFVDRVEWIAMPDALQAVNALKAGEIDYIWQPSHDLLPLLQADPNITLEEVSRLGNQLILRPNHLHPPFNDPVARRAVWYALDQKEILAAAVGNPEYYQTCLAALGCGTALESFAGSEDKGFLAGNVAKARELLGKSNYAGQPVVLMNPTDYPLLANVGPVIKKQLEAAGFKVELSSMDWQTLNTVRFDKTAGKWNMFPTSLAAADLDPLLSYFDMDCKTSFVGWPCDPAMGPLQTAFADAPTVAAQKAAAEAIQKYAFEASPFYFLGQYSTLAAIRSDLKDVVKKSPIPVFWNLKKK